MLPVHRDGDAEHRIGQPQVERGGDVGVVAQQRQTAVSRVIERVGRPGRRQQRQRQHRHRGHDQDGPDRPPGLATDRDQARRDPADGQQRGRPQRPGDHAAAPARTPARAPQGRHHHRRVHPVRPDQRGAGHDRYRRADAEEGKPAQQPDVRTRGPRSGGGPGLALQS